MTKGSKKDVKQYHLHKAYPEKLQFEVYDLNEYRTKNIEKASTPHSHSYYQIIWFFNGDGTHVIDFETYNITENTILFISKDQVHSFDDNLDVKGWLVHFNDIFFMHSDVDIFLKYNIFNHLRNPCFTINSATVESAECYIQLIRKELSNKYQFGHHEVIRYLLKSMLITLNRTYRNSEETKLKLSSSYEEHFFKFKNLIENYYSEGLSIKEYADLLKISTKTLSTITKEVVAKSPSQLISERIILEARRLLQFTPLQIGEIAFQLGFEDVSYFIKYFKKYLGSSPKVYRDTITK